MFINNTANKSKTLEKLSHLTGKKFRRSINRISRTRQSQKHWAKAVKNVNMGSEINRLGIFINTRNGVHMSQKASECMENPFMLRYELDAGFRD